MKDDNMIILGYCLPDDEKNAIEIIQRGLENIKNDTLSSDKVAEVIIDEDNDSRIGIEIYEAVHCIWIDKKDFLEIAERIKQKEWGENHD